ncbi:uncharacterized protein [Dendrobates tinctorius]|uniref:uncharacterized protein n=1 Tax=Dendrobates tinctorius TaxID=92724 RepID=UPI003CCA53F7
MRGDERCKEEIPTDNRTDYWTRSSEEHLMFSDFTADDHDIQPDMHEQYAIIPDIPQALHSKSLSSDTFQKVLTSDLPQTVKQNKNSRQDVEHKRSHKEQNPFSCSACSKYFTRKSSLVNHEKSHTGKNEFLCLKCGKCFTHKSYLAKHLRSHTEEKPFSFSECGKCFKQKCVLATHQKTHTGEAIFMFRMWKKFFTKITTC